MHFDQEVQIDHDFKSFKIWKYSNLSAAGFKNVYFIKNIPNLLISQIFKNYCQSQIYASLLSIDYHYSLLNCSLKELVCLIKNKFMSSSLALWQIHLMVKLRYQKTGKCSYFSWTLKIIINWCLEWFFLSIHKRKSYEFYFNKEKGFDSDQHFTF